MATRDLSGVPPVPPSDMDPAFRVFVEKRKASVEKSLKAVHEELATFREASAGFWLIGGIICSVVSVSFSLILLRLIVF